MSCNPPTRAELADRYIDALPYAPYPVQEEALLAWFSSDEGVLVCAPTGMGKTLIAEAALFEALHLGRRAYYTTPLVALTDQKYREMQQRAIEWGFSPGSVGLVTGNRRENPQATVLVVVAEILFNRLLHREAFGFDDVYAVVMDEFHSINDRERGIVWEFTLGLLPPHVRLLLLSATVGNAAQFVDWLRHAHQRRLELVQSDQRKVPLEFHWIGDRLLNEHIEQMSAGDEDQRRTPALIFCFNREQCWTVAEQLKGRGLISKDRQQLVAERLREHDLSRGAGPALRQLLLRGVGVHHAGVLPRYRRLVEELFQDKLLSVAVCTETLSSGINLPARSVVLPSILKGPADDRKPVEASTAHQIFGRAGRPQFDARGYVFALAHEDDVKIARWREQYDRIPDGVKDPALLKAKKALKRKMPKRRAGETYWTEAQFRKICASPPAKLRSTGPLPWRLLAYMLDASPEIELVRRLVSKRLMDSKRLERAQRQLDEMLSTLWRAGYVELVPEPPDGWPGTSAEAAEATETDKAPRTARDAPAALAPAQSPTAAEGAGDATSYRPMWARPTADLPKLLMLRSVNPLYGLFLVGQLGIADRAERIQAMESVLELPRSIGPFVRVPPQDKLPPGPLATSRLDEQLLRLGLATADELRAAPPEEDRPRRRTFDEPPPRVLTLAEKLKLLFDYDFPRVHDVKVNPVWAAGAVIEFGHFDRYVTSYQLQKQEGVIFRHLLRMILLVAEMARFEPPDGEPGQWAGEMGELGDRLTAICREVDPASTEETLDEARSAGGL